jgi:hypothetical protein
MLYKKNLLTTDTGDTLIRFVDSRMRLLFRLLESDSKTELYDQISTLADKIEEDMPVLIYYIQDFAGVFYALVLIEWDNFSNSTLQSFEKRAKYRSKNLLQWYIYTNIAHDHENNLTDYEDEDGTD